MSETLEWPLPTLPVIEPAGRRNAQDVLGDVAAALLEHDWPGGFTWDYGRISCCALGLAGLLHGPWGFEVLQSFPAISYNLYAKLGIHSSQVTPEHVAAEIELLLKEMRTQGLVWELGVMTP